MLFSLLQDSIPSQDESEPVPTTLAPSASPQSNVSPNDNNSGEGEEEIPSSSPSSVNKGLGVGASVAIGLGSVAVVGAGVYLSRNSAAKNQLEQQEALGSSGEETEEEVGSNVNPELGLQQETTSSDMEEPTFVDTASSAS